MTEDAGTTPGRAIVVLAALVVVIAGIKAATAIVVPFLCAAFLAILSLPALEGLKRRGLPAALALTVVLLVIVVGAGVIMVVIGSSLTGFQSNLPSYTAQFELLVEDAKTWIGDRGVEISDRTDDAFDPKAILGFVGRALAQIGGLMSNAFVILLILAFLLAEITTIAAKIRSLARDQGLASERVQQITSSINRYFSIKIWVSAATGLSVALLSWMFGVDYAVLWGFLAFLLNFVPNIGSFLAAIPPVLICLVQPGQGLSPALGLAAGIVVVNVVIGNLIEPRLMGRGLDLSTLVVFLSLLFWGWVLGPIGMLLSVPLTITLKIVLDAFPETRKLALLLGAHPPPEPGVE